MFKAAIINDTGGSGHHGCALVMTELHKGLSRASITPAWSHPVGVDWRPIADDILKNPKVDVVIVNGEGSIHHAATRPRAVYLPEFAQFARYRMGVPSYLINATIAEINDEAAKYLRAFTGIYVRDGGSELELRRYGIASEVVPDLTLGAALPHAWRRRGTCVTDSVVKDVNEALRHLAMANRWPYYPIKGRARRSRWRWAPTPGYLEFACLLASHELVVTGRFHTVTMCIATGTPFVAVESNTPKISWLLADVFGDRGRLVDPSCFETLHIERFSRWTDRERRAIQSAVMRARIGRDAMFQRIRASIGNTSFVA